VILGAAVASLAFAATPGLAQSPAAPANPYPLSQGGTLNIDFATYNPLSLIIRQQGWLENALAPQGISVNWVQSAGSNKANEALRAAAIDVGSTAGSAAPPARPSPRSRTCAASTSPRPRAPTPTSSCSSRSRRPACRSRR
jgi:sulfonate transport system substrate-binding protein